jgi:uncharacterized protein involved in response to NO
MTHPAIFNLGFRAFFSGASVLAIASISMWVLYLNNSISVELLTISPLQWHSHEMLYGYAMAVIAGFLLTSVRNWTGKQTLAGYGLAALFSLWAGARLFFMMGDGLLSAAAFFDLAFHLVLLFVIAKPIIQVKQWRQLAILSKLLLLGAGNMLFYWGAITGNDAFLQLSIYGALYLIIGLILTIGRRVIPFFIERGVGYPVTLWNSKPLDISSMLVFLGFFISELFLDLPLLSVTLAGLMFCITTIRLIGWHTPGIWKTPLLWGLYLALCLINLGFALFIIQHWLSLSPYLALHAFAIGGVGGMTIAMMARVSIGHTGRNLKEIPALLPAAIALCLGSALTRSVLPILAPENYTLWLNISAGAWVLAFSLLFLSVIPYLSAPRPDGKPG